MAPTPTSTTTDTERRVLVVFHERILGGATIAVLRLVPMLEERGWRFSFWVPRPSDLHDHLAAEGHEVRGADRLVSYSLEVLRLPPGPARRLTGQPAYLRAFWHQIRGQPASIVHVNSVATLAEGAVARAAGLPVVMHVHEMVAPSPKGRIAAALVRRVANRVIAVSDACAGTISTAVWRPDIAHGSAPIPGLPLLRERPAGGRFRVGTIGALSQRKGTDTFVAAARLLPADRFELEIVGAATDPLDAAWAEEVMRDAAAAGVRHYPRADVASKLADWDAFVLPSRRDPFPNVVLEAMAAGLPVVGTRVDGIVEQLAGGAGLLVEPADPEALAATLEQLASDEEQRLGLAAKAREKVIREYTPERQADAIERAYVKALERR